MQQQRGLGRGLAAILPHSHLHPPVPPHKHPESHDPMAELAAELVRELASNQSGLGLIYRMLELLVEKHHLTDAAVVVDEPGIGRQVFRANRQPIDDESVELLSAPQGLYTDPELEADEIEAETLVDLCRVALRTEMLRYDAWHDSLTHLYDRRSFDRLLEMEIARSTRYRWPFTLVLIDLDGLKQINDTMGHDAGDRALRELADCFHQVLRFGDNAARIGGDEFALILPSTDPQAVPALLARIASHHEGVPEFSYGIATCPNEASTFNELYKLADERLYQQKMQRSAGATA